MNHVVLLLLGQDGGNATAQHVMDRGSVFEEGCGHSLWMSKNSYVYLRICILPEEEQSKRNIWGNFNKSNQEPL